MTNPQSGRSGRSARSGESASESGEAVARRLEEAYENYSRAIQAAYSAEDRQKSFEEAYLSYLRGAFGAIAKQDPVSYFEAYLNYMRGTREAALPSESRERLVEAFRTYLNAYKEAWTEVDVRAFDATALAALAQGMQALAYSASWTLALESEGSAA